MMQLGIPTRSDSHMSKAVRMLDQSGGFRPSPRFRLKRNMKSAKAKPQDNSIAPKTPNLLGVYHFTSEKLIPINKIKSDKVRFNLKTEIFPSFTSRQTPGESKKKERLQIFKRMLEPRVLRTKMFCQSPTRKRALSADQMPKCPLLFTFGRQ